MKSAVVLVAVLLVSCTGQVSEKPVMTRQQRQQATEAALNRTPEPRTYRMDGNELKVVDVPISGSTGYVSTQRCFVWRDTELRTAAISCPQAPSGMLVSDED